jgi:dolichol-phosphate mannosyltransferase
MNGFSIVVPFYNEEDNIGPLHKEITGFLKGHHYELIYVNDGSSDGTYAELQKASSEQGFADIKIINFPVRLGQSLALKAGLDKAVFDIIIFMDGDLQYDPRDIPRLLEGIGCGYDLAQGIRKVRNDPLLKRLCSMAGNLALHIFCGNKFKDVGCSLKAFKKDFASGIAFHSGTHRLLPVYLYLNGCSVTEIEVNHRRRAGGKSKYGFLRIIEFLFQLWDLRFGRYKK